MKIAVVGCGSWGRILVRNFHALGPLGAVADPAPAGRRLATQLVPGIETTGDIAALIRCFDLDEEAPLPPALAEGRLPCREFNHRG